PSTNADKSVIPRNKRSEGSAFRHETKSRSLAALGMTIRSDWEQHLPVLGQRPELVVDVHFQRVTRPPNRGDGIGAAVRQQLRLLLELLVHSLGFVDHLA